MTTCHLCDLPVQDGVTAESGDESFCCRGCLEVYRSLGDVAITAEPVTEQPDTPDDAETAYFAVDGMHCATCEVYLESVVQEQDGVYDAQASYASEAIKVSYDPEVVRESTLREALSGVGYTARPHDASSDEGRIHTLEDRLIVGGVLGMVAMMSYAIFLYPTYFGHPPLVSLGQYDGAHVYGQLAGLTAVILLYTGGPMLKNAYVSVRAGMPNVDLLVTIAALAAYLYSVGSLVAGHTDIYFDVTIVVVLAVTGGSYYRDRMKDETAGLLTELTALRVNEATRENGDTISVDAIESGDRLLVKPGERIPVDGIVREGTAAVDEALVTGESIPETREPGDTVRGGAIVTDSPIVVEASGSESTLDNIVELLWDIQASRPGAQRVADRLATVFVPFVLVAAVAITSWQLLAGQPVAGAMLTGLTVLIVSCPCALGLATPLAIVSGLQTAADRGIILTTPALFEHSADIETVVLDKTGTLTDGEMGVTDTIVTDETTAQELLSHARAVEQYATHPVADAIVAHTAQTDGGTRVDSQAGPPQTFRESGIESFEQYPKGVSGIVDSSRVLVGTLELFAAQGYDVPETVERAAANVRERGNVPAVIGWDERARGVIGVGDEFRDGWQDAVGDLDGEIVVLTGDDGPSAEQLRDTEIVDRVYAGVPSNAKAETVRRLAATETVAMVGDGSNDAPALAAADVGIALESGTELATDAADAVVLEDDLERLPDVFRTATATRRRIRENLAWAFLYNGVAIPLAITGLLNPLFAAIAMSGSSLFVVANSSRTVAVVD